MPPCPSNENDFLANHVARLCASLRQLTGRDLVADDLPPEVAARALFEAPFVVVSHDRADDPMLTYGNRRALELFESTWEEFVTTPSRLTAEVPLQAERQRLLSAVSQRGFIDDYSGIRISRGGRRFRIDAATVWNLFDETGSCCGQAATFGDWTFL